MALSELKPCPFCGGEAQTSTFRTESLFSHDEVEYLHIGCPNDCDIFMEGEQQDDLRAAWNTRALLDAARAGSDAEPVAWLVETVLNSFMVRRGDFADTPEDRASWVRNGYVVTNLYAHPPRAEQPVMSREAVEEVVARGRDDEWTSSQIADAILALASLEFPNPAGETIRTTQGAGKAADPMTGTSPVGSVAPLPPPSLGGEQEAVAWLYEWTPHQFEQWSGPTVNLEDPRVYGGRRYRNVEPLVRASPVRGAGEEVAHG